MRDQTTTNIIEPGTLPHAVWMMRYFGSPYGSTCTRVFLRKTTVDPRGAQTILESIRKDSISSIDITVACARKTCEGIFKRNLFLEERVTSTLNRHRRTCAAHNIMRVTFAAHDIETKLIAMLFGRDIEARLKKAHASSAIAEWFDLSTYTHEEHGLFAYFRNGDFINDVIERKHGILCVFEDLIIPICLLHAHCIVLIDQLQKYSISVKYKLHWSL